MSSSAASLSLAPHPQTLAPMVRSLDASVFSTQDELTIVYRLYGDMARLTIPTGNTTERCDNLWEHTCFELFIAPVGSESYREFNFSPAGQWAIYDFTTYRASMSAPDDIPIPQTETRLTEGRLELEVHLPLGSLPSLAHQQKAFHLGLSAVIESRDTPDAPRSYWALHHPLERPDFHHRSGFTFLLSSIA